MSIDWSRAERWLDETWRAGQSGNLIILPFPAAHKLEALRWIYERAGDEWTIVSHAASDDYYSILLKRK